MPYAKAGERDWMSRRYEMGTRGHRRLVPLPLSYPTLGDNERQSKCCMLITYKGSCSVLTPHEWARTF